MKKTNTIVVQETNISVTKVNNEDYICLTDMVKANKESGRTEILIQSWMRRKDTILFLAAWESLYNPVFNYSEFDVIKSRAGVNTIHTDAIKDFVIPKIDVEQQKLYVYADEADLLNLALWGCTAKQWREANVNHAQKGLNIRDVASINELVVLSNMESFNAELLKRGIDKSKRYTYLWEMAQSQLTRLNAVDAEKGFRAIETAPEVKAIN
ncbi:hypothetical protein SAMD00024442_18_34 [Candidatus Symbiothrix dinenymphae]|nr:hypothetical protein SAMD00024442_18_34 [Candidatus Symbiothrix dinenymphae]